MIAFLRGTLQARALDHVVVEVAGVGYHLAMSTHSIGALGQVGSEVLVHTHLVVRENDISLIGFADEAERDVFLRLVEVSGIGPKGALAVLSTLTPAGLALAVATDDVALVSTAPGVGKKTAQRIVIELKDRLSLAEGSPWVPPLGGAAGQTLAGSEPSAEADARTALGVMGFTAAEIAEALNGAPAGADLQALVAHGLKFLGGRR